MIVLETKGNTDADEAALIRELCEVIRAADPDVIENHNLHGFDLPFLNTSCFEARRSAGPRPESDRQDSGNAPRVAAPLRSTNDRKRSGSCSRVGS